MNKPLRIATVQFENRSGDKKYNLERIAFFAEEAARKGAQAVAFHECSISGYSFARHLSMNEFRAVAESLPTGKSVKRLQEIAAKNHIVVLAGLFEVDDRDQVYNTYVCVSESGLIARHRKLHPFIHPELTPGDAYTVFDLFGWRCGILTCYDNNVIENVRATALMGTSVIFMPHVTMCTPSTRPGAGFVDPALWTNRQHDPTSLRLEFDGMKGRAWLMKWLPARAYDNGIYAIFSNPIGMDDDQLKNGCSMIIDPFGDILAECRALDDDMVIADCHYDKIEASGGHRYRQARRPDLYRNLLLQAHDSRQRVSWLHAPDK